jgi:hypothetical protein
MLSLRTLLLSLLTLALCGSGCVGLSDLLNQDIASYPDASSATGDAEILGTEDSGSELACQTDEDCAGLFPEATACQKAMCDAVQMLCLLGAREDDSPCDDGNECTLDTVCMEGDCGAGTDLVCNDDNECTDDSCDAMEGCLFDPNNAACDDGDKCTLDDECVDGSCKGDNMDCSDGNPCTEDYCDEKGECQYNGISEFPCNDGDDCTANDFCVEGECISGENICADCGNGECEESENCDNCKADCGECEGDCCEPRQTPLCDDPQTVDCVCELDVFCCETAWDDVCVEQAIEACGLICEGPNPCGNDVCEEFEDCQMCPEDCGECPGDDCCIPHETPGCADQEMAGCVCGEDPFCCDVSWDDICVEEVEEFGCGECEVVEPYCGDDICDGFENCDMCPEDCGPCGECGDEWCDEFENCDMCPEDCGPCGECGDEWCDDFENCEMCPEDCGPCEEECEAMDWVDCDSAVEGHTVEGSANVNSYPCIEGDYTAPEMVYAFEPDCSAPVVVTLNRDPDAEGFVDLAILDGQEGCWGNSCIAGAWMEADSAELQFTGLEGHLYYIVVDGYQGAVAGFELYVECLCGQPFCGDGVCGENENCFTCPGDCGDCPAESCCKAHDTPACESMDCAGQVCEFSPICCQDEWVGECAAIAINVCPECLGGPDCGDGECGGNWETCSTCPEDCGDCPYSNCCEQHADTGCDDEACTEIVCAVDGYCCQSSWDGTCAGEAQDWCSVCGGTEPFCGDMDCSNNEDCEGCPQDCGECPYCGDGNCNPDWDEWCDNCPEDCGECPYCGDGNCDQDWEEDCEICEEDCGNCAWEGFCCMAHETPGCSDPQIASCVCEFEPICCELEWNEFCIELAQECGACSGDCCEINEDSGCADPVCVEIVCEADPYCCDSHWDNICVGEAEDWCEVCGGMEPYCGDGECTFGDDCENCEQDCGECPFCGDGICDQIEDCEQCPDDCGPCNWGGPCCIPHDMPGCDKADVAFCVCDFSPECCENGWDDFCVEVAQSQCGGCSDSCCEAHESPGCNDLLCMETVCGEDTFCCDQQWDGLCADHAAEMCEVCGAMESFCGDEVCDGNENCETCPHDCDCEPESNCCFAHEEPGCEDPTCSQMLCMFNPGCCNDAWTDVCVTLALQVCQACGGNFPGGP